MRILASKLSVYFLLKTLSGEKENADRLPSTLDADTFLPPFIQVRSTNSISVRWTRGPSIEPSPWRLAGDFPRRQEVRVRGCSVAGGQGRPLQEDGV